MKLQIRILKGFPNESGPHYYNPSHRVTVDALTDVESVFTLLHELGHAYHQHTRYQSTPRTTMIRQEIQAWVYAERCIAPEYRDALGVSAMYNIGTYIKRCRSWTPDKIAQYWVQYSKELAAKLQGGTK
jgi:Zn-dependent peptidase ImmA (M78 family)